MFYTMYLDGEYQLLVLHPCNVILECPSILERVRLPRVTTVACRCQTHMANLQATMALFIASLKQRYVSTTPYFFFPEQTTSIQCYHLDDN